MMASWDDAPSKIYIPLPCIKATGCGLTRWYSGGWDIVLDGLMGTFEWHSQRDICYYPCKMLKWNQNQELVLMTGSIQSYKDNASHLASSTHIYRCIYIYPCHVCITWTYYRIALRTYQLFPELAFVQEKSRRPKTMAMVPMMSHDVARCLIFHVPNTHIFYAAYKDMLYVPFCRCRPVTLRSSWMPWPSTKSIRWCSGPDVGPCHLVVGHPGGDRVGMWIWTFAYVCICHYLQICW